MYVVSVYRVDQTSDEGRLPLLENGNGWRNDVDFHPVNGTSDQFYDLLAPYFQYNPDINRVLCVCLNGTGGINCLKVVSYNRDTNQIRLGL